jgi:hypothetical protein
MKFLPFVSPAFALAKLATKKDKSGSDNSTAAPINPNVGQVPTNPMSGKVGLG